ncbi:MAG TPA: hypothetical protein VK422_18430 [Pyrinomonadaceae bacterium]|nr:hypothetical protein [Pyrinomonadaceae bacterium]
MWNAGKGAASLLLAMLLAGCNSPAVVNSGSPANANAAAANANTAGTTKSGGDDGLIASGTGVEKEKPAPGKGHVQGRALFNGKPAAGVEVKLCSKFSRFIGGCSGETFTTKTDAQGEYLLKDVPPGVYEGLLVKVFDTDSYVFATSGIIQSAKYKIEDGQTFFAPDANLFKSDLKLTSPKAGAKVAGDGIELKWEPYADAAYYKFSVFADSASGAKPEYDLINKRVEGTSYALDKPLSPGAYTVKVEAFNGDNVRLSQSSDDIKFTVTGAAAK